jgi:hypothetical protein
VVIWNKNFNKILFSHYLLTICSLSKMGKLKYLSGGQYKNKNIYTGIKFCCETGLNTLIFSCFVCLGAPYLQGR